MAGHSRPKDGVAYARLCPAIHVFLLNWSQDVDARHKAGHDEHFEFLADYDFGPSVAFPVPEMELGGVSAGATGAAGGSPGLANCAAASALVRLVSASGPVA